MVLWVFFLHVQFADLNTTSTAVVGLSGISLGGHVLTVCLASPEAPLQARGGEGRRGCILDLGFMPYVSIRVCPWGKEVLYSCPACCKWVGGGSRLPPPLHDPGITGLYPVCIDIQTYHHDLVILQSHTQNNRWKGKTLLLSLSPSATPEP